jgi:hypothetical protein
VWQHEEIFVGAKTYGVDVGEHSASRKKKKKKKKKKV